MEMDFSFKGQGMTEIATFFSFSAQRNPIRNAGLTKGEFILSALATIASPLREKSD
jgi:hypothetical protein